MAHISPVRHGERPERVRERFAQTARAQPAHAHPGRVPQEPTLRLLAVGQAHQKRAVLGEQAKATVRPRNQVVGWDRGRPVQAIIWHGSSRHDPREHGLVENPAEEPVRHM